METISKDMSLTESETLKTIYERRAIRKYKDKPVERVLIEKIIDAGRMAPSAINRQPWNFYVLIDKTTIKSFSREISGFAMKELAGSGIKKIVRAARELLHFSHGLNLHGLEDPVFHGAPVVIFITAPADNEWAALDIGMCSQNIMLAARSLGLDTCPVGFGKFVEKTKIFPRLNVPASDRVHLAIILGYGDEKPEVHERKQNNIHFIF